jgi:transposase
MKIIGCDFHTRQQQIAMLDTVTGELVERQLQHQNGEARRFYEQLAKPVRVGIEATGYTRWFEQLMTELGHELWMGDAARIRASVVRKQKNDERDAAQILELLVQDRFPRIWMPTPEERDLRQLVLHRVKLVQMRTKVMNQLQAMAMGEGLCRRKKLWSKVGRAELEGLSLGPWASRRRKELLELLEQLEKPMAELQQAAREQAEAHPAAARLMTHPGVGPLTSLSFVLTIGPVERFARSRQVSSYLGLDPRLNCSAGRMKIGAISKQGNSTTRWLLVEAGQTAARKDEDLRRLYRRLKFRRGSQIAKVAVARRLAVRLYWMLRSRANYADLVARLVRMRGSSGSAVMEDGVHREAE